MKVESILGIVREFVTAQGGEGAAIEADTRLLQEGHVDSFALVELIDALGRSLAKDLGDGALLPEDFESVAVLHARLSELFS